MSDHVFLAATMLTRTRAPRLQEGVLPFHLVSDHVFLAATMLISLHVELVCVLSDAVRLYRKQHHGRQVGAAGL